MVFVVSLIAIFSFTSAAQGWLLTKLRWYEVIMLLIVTVSMFRPDFVLNRIFPEYTTYNNDFNEQIYYEETRKIRLHVTRYTDYGERYKMFAFLIDSESKISLCASLIDAGPSTVMESILNHAIPLCSFNCGFSKLLPEFSLSPYIIDEWYEKIDLILNSYSKEQEKYIELLDLVKNKVIYNKVDFLRIILQ